MILDQVRKEVAAQLDAQANLGVNIRTLDHVPESGPANLGVWFRIRNVTAIFADLNGSTALSTFNNPKDAAYAYTYFIRAMTAILDEFSAKYIDIQGDGIFGLFSGEDSQFRAAACAVTMRTEMERDVAVRFRKDASVKWKLTAGIGIDRGTLLVRRLGLRGAKLNEVWAGKPVNTAAKLSSLANSNQILVSNRVFNQYSQFPRERRQAILRSCGCQGRVRGSGLDLPARLAAQLWTEGKAPKNLGLDFEQFHRRKEPWCAYHGPEFCQMVATGRRRSR